MADLADGASGDQTGGFHQGGPIAVGQVDHVDDASLGRCFGHFCGMGVIRGQRLFTQHMFASGQQGHGRGVMHRVGGDV